jgi:type IV secretory pathway protease TraF
MTRFGYVMTTYFASLGICASALFHPLPRLIWNASASVPIGLYTVHPAGALHVTELVVVQPPEALASFLDERRYLPRAVPMLKRVLALPGQTVCRTDRAIAVDGIAMGDALNRDRSGRPLPVWQGLPAHSCRRSLPDEPAVRGLPRRPVFWPASRHHDHRPG